MEKPAQPNIDKVEKQLTKIGCIMGLWFIAPLLAPFAIMVTTLWLGVPMFKGIAVSFPLMFAGQPVEKSTEEIAGGKSKEKYVKITGYELPETFFVRYESKQSRNPSPVREKRIYRFIVSDTSEMGKVYSAKFDQAAALSERIQAVTADQMLPESLVREIEELSAMPNEGWATVLAVTSKPETDEDWKKDRSRYGSVNLINRNRPLEGTSEFYTNPQPLPSNLTEDQIQAAQENASLREQNRFQREKAAYLLKSVAALNKKVTVSGYIMKVPGRELNMMKENMITISGYALHEEVRPSTAFRLIFIFTMIFIAEVLFIVVLVAKHRMGKDDVRYHEPAMFEKEIEQLTRTVEQISSQEAQEYKDKIAKRLNQQQSPAPPQKFCAKCGAPTNKSKKFCVRCGARI